MCWCFSFGLSSKKKRQSSSSSGEKKRRDVPDEPLHGKGKTVVAEVSEKRRSSETHRKRRTGESTSPRSSRREKEEHRPRTQQYRDDTYPSRDSYRPSLNVQVPDMWHRSVEPGSTNSSQEALLNPRPHRSTHQRQRHPKPIARRVSIVLHKHRLIARPHALRIVAEVHVSMSATPPPRAKLVRVRRTRPLVACLIDALLSSLPLIKPLRMFEEKLSRSPRHRRDGID
ncbi:hypothetical protein SNOG_00954 [Parastagonospora nodorum SN15]|uniref:Uncharacterized protein n=1 Tax=Phaeosphaeria nodorum (strain SN15 / ATCC MYA-4574 / FGSC 10173) TaxID=321614 RepID=Q0V4W0_PHANO|nr:hypothetical protein SNOG_00954 [Parastagonospora nodorum SN15]EAT92449.2 hypothetical protein SNOG_00954 [Parastagonospora nodorum SN15]